jgi:ADP-ribose pyrophosphatase
MNLKLLQRNTVYRGRVFTIVVDDVEYPSGNRSVREVAEHGGGAVVLALFPDERFMMVNQHRYPFNEFILELPAGKLEKGEDPLHCAQRELAEETGYRAEEWRKLTSIFTTPGFCSEVLHIYLATGLSALDEGRMLEEGEQTMTLRFLPLAEATAMIERQEIRDAKTICGILMGERLLRKGPGG